MHELLPGRPGNQGCKDTGRFRDRDREKDGTTQTLKGSHLLVSIGQLPNSDDLGLEKAGIEIDKNGFIRHNNKLETTVSGVWVMGDVKGGPAFTHVSYDDYLVIYDNLVNGKDRTVDNRLVPTHFIRIQNWVESD